MEILVILEILVHLVTRIIDVQKQLLVTHKLRVMKLSTKQKVLWPLLKLFQQNVLQQILRKKDDLFYKKFQYFTFLFINYHDVIKAVSIYCCIIKNGTNRKHLLSFYDANIK